MTTIYDFTKVVEHLEEVDKDLKGQRKSIKSTIKILKEEIEKRIKANEATNSNS